jgi:Rieske Fe-S protein
MLQKKISKRELINYILSAGISTLMVIAACLLYSYIMPPEGIETSVSSVVAAAKGELAPNSSKIFKFGDKPGILINTINNELLAFNAVCTHLNCTVQYDPLARYIWCACHNGHFDLNGNVISGPPPRPLEKYNVNIRGEDVVVSKKN